MEMEYQVKGPYLIIQVGKELDHHQAEHIRQVLERIGRERDIRNIIFDFTKTTFMDSSGGCVSGGGKAFLRVRSA